MTTQFIVRFPDLAAYHAAQALEVNHVRVPVASPKRQFISVEVPAADLAGPAAEHYALEQLELFEHHYGADVRPDMQFELEARDIFDPTLFGPDLPGEPSLDDVLARIRADGLGLDAWRRRRCRHRRYRDQRHAIRISCLEACRRLAGAGRHALD